MTAVATSTGVSTTLRALYSMPVLGEVTRVVAERYDLGEIVSCALVNRGFNDVYELRADSGDRFVFRIGNRRVRREANLDYETAFIAHLDNCGVPVAPPLATREGRFWCRVPLAEGERPAVLFRYLAGRVARRGSALDAEAQGRTLGEIHRAGRSYAGPASRLQLGGQYLIETSLGAVLDLPTPEAADRDFLKAFAARLAEHLEASKNDLTWGSCHGDCHGHNARLTDSGLLGRRAFFFDFDDGGPGWLAYDLAVYLWNKALNPDTLNLWPSFLRGYQGVTPLTPADLDATLFFVPIRHLWLLGEYAGRADEWGLDNLSPIWFSRQVDFLRGWEDKYLVARLF